MSIKDLTITDQNVQGVLVVNQPDRLTGTAEENKKVFDAFPQLIRKRFNELLEALAGAGAAGEIPIGPIEGVTAENVQQALEAIQQNLTAYINKIKAATGAAEVGVSQISGMQAQNVQKALEELRKAIDDSVSGIIPGGSITADMLAGPIPTEKGGTGATTTQAALAALGAGVRPNLLDNAIFIGGGTAGNLPVNQIGETTYTYEFPGYVFDRWKIRDDQTIIEFEDDCIVVKNGKSFDGAVIAFGQTLEKSLSNIDSDITISCFVKEMQGDWYIACNSINSSDTKLTIGITEKYFPIETVNQDGKELYLFKNSQGENDYIKIKAIKIEQGKNQSLAYADENNIYLLPQPDSDYATQLAQCRMHFIRSNNAASIAGVAYSQTELLFTVPIPEMRTAPAMKNVNAGGLITKNGAQIPASALSFMVLRIGASGCVIKVTSTQNAEIGPAVLLNFSADFTAEL